MELAVLIAAAIGIFLFAISYLKFAFEGFRYHFITGLLALIPVVNLVALPTLWDRTNRMLIIGLIGLVVAVGAWFAGAGKTFQSYWGDNPAQIAAPAGIAPPINVNNTSGNATSNYTVASTERTISLLPSKALYRLDFESAPTSQIKTLIGRIVRITDSDHIVTDGRIQSVTPSSVFIEQSENGSIAYEMMIGNIKSIKVMVKKAAR